MVDVFEEITFSRYNMVDRCKNSQGFWEHEQDLPMYKTEYPSMERGSSTKPNLLSGYLNW